MTKVEEDALAHASAMLASGPSVLVGLRLGASAARRLREPDTYQIAFDWPGGRAAAELAAFRALARLGARFDDALSASVETGTVAAIARADAATAPAVVYVTFEPLSAAATRATVRGIAHPAALSKRHPAEEAARKLADLMRAANPVD
jgi:hypothetical protein